MRAVVFAIAMVALLALAQDEPPTTAAATRANGDVAAADEASSKDQVGLASYYARFFDGRKTASGEPFDADAMLAAHPHLPFDTLVRVTNLENERSVDVRIVDRGPARRIQKEGVIIDLSPAAAKALGFVQDGRTKVRVEILELGSES